MPFQVHGAGQPPEVAPAYELTPLREVFQNPDPSILPKAVFSYFMPYVGGGARRLSNPGILILASQMFREADTVDVEKLEQYRTYFVRNIDPVICEHKELSKIRHSLICAEPSDILNVLIRQAEWQAKKKVFCCFPERSIQVASRFITLSSISDELLALCKDLSEYLDGDHTILIRKTS